MKQARKVIITCAVNGSVHTPSMSQLKPEVASLNLGSMNFGLYEMLDRYKDFKHDWEAPNLAGREDRVFGDTFHDLAHVLQACGSNDTRFELECHDIGHPYTAQHFLQRKLLEPPLFVQSVFGLRGGIGADPEGVMQMRRTAERLFADEFYWSVLRAGSNQMKVAVQAASMGANMRVGLEDSLWPGKCALAKSNAEQVAQIRRILEELGLQVATPDEARDMLQLKGADQVEL